LRCHCVSATNPKSLFLFYHRAMITTMNDVGYSERIMRLVSTPWRFNVSVMKPPRASPLFPFSCSHHLESRVLRCHIIAPRSRSEARANQAAHDKRVKIMHT
jgi:hypothetical protein